MNVLGLDLGTNSVGWALVTEQNAGEAPDIVCGVYIFPETGELQKDGHFTSHRQERGIKRRMRRNLAHKRQRRDNLVNLLRANGMYPARDEDFERLFHQHTDSSGRPAHPYALRKRALDEMLSLEEFGRALYHICRRRGYLSTALLKLKILEAAGVRPQVKLAQKADERESLQDEETTHGGSNTADEAKERSALKRRMAEVRSQMACDGARTLGEYYADQLADRTPVRGCGPDKFKDPARRDPKRADALGQRADRLLFEEEFDKLWEAQARFHPGVFSEALKNTIKQAIFGQRDLRPTTALVGTCEFITDRRRAPRASLVAQRSIVLQTLVNLTLADDLESEQRKLSADEIKTLASILDQQPFLTWEQAKAAISLPDARFRDEPLPNRGRARGRARPRPALKGNLTAACMRAALGNKWAALSPCSQAEMVNELISGRPFPEIAPGLRSKFSLTDDELYELAVSPLPDGHMSHCTRVLKKLEPWFMRGMVYSEACEKAGYRAPNTSTEVARPGAPAIPPSERIDFTAQLNNPVVQRSVLMACRVINAVIRRHGKPDRIRIEMPRDVSKTNNQREQIWKSQDRRASERGRAATLLTEHGLGVTETNIKKVLLWEEADRRCPYFPGVCVGIEELIQHYDIDHIVPRSISFDNSWVNLTICPSDENIHRKGKQTPYQAYGQLMQWGDVCTHVRRHMQPSKRDRILCEHWEEDEFTNRALSDTRYISRVILTEAKKLGVPVEVSRGQITALLRNAWELGGCLPVTHNPEQDARMEKWRKDRVKKQEKPQFDHRHHALDAIVTALTDRQTLKLLTAFFQQQEMYGLTWSKVPKPKRWPTMPSDLAQLMDTCTVVFAPKRECPGPLHKEKALPPPPQNEVRAAIAALPPDRRPQLMRCVVVGKQLVYLNAQHQPQKAYNLESNHHAVVWQREAAGRTGKSEKEFKIVTMIEASRRAQHGEAVVCRHRPGYRYVMSLCKNDVVEWAGEQITQLMRVAAISDGDIHLLPLIDATKCKGRVERVRGPKDCHQFLRRVVLDPIGVVIGYEPGRPA